jgi:hypothetical protein
VVTSRPGSLLRTRRALYEAVLTMERDGAVVVERRMALADVALSPSACLVVWTDDALGVGAFARTYAWIALSLGARALPGFCG